MHLYVIYIYIYICSQPFQSSTHLFIDDHLSHLVSAGLQLVTFQPTVATPILSHSPSTEDFTFLAFCKIYRRELPFNLPLKLQGSNFFIQLFSSRLKFPQDSPF